MNSNDKTGIKVASNLYNPNSCQKKVYNFWNRFQTVVFFKELTKHKYNFLLKQDTKAPYLLLLVIRGWFC